MADSLDDFAKRISEVAVKIEENVGKTIQKTALAVDQTVVLTTPVDTGRARSNWLVSINISDNKTIEAYVPGKKGSTGSENVQAAIDHGKSVIATFKPTQDTSIIISNNVGYIGPLNDGSSVQAPAGFVERAVADAVAVIKRAKVVK